MKNTRVSDLVWSWLLVGLNILSILLSIIPGFIKMYDKQTDSYIGGSLLDVPDSNIMSNMAPLLLIVFAYCLIVSVMYLRGQSLGAIRGYFVGAVATCVLALMALLPSNTVATVPYAVIPAIWGLVSVLSFIRMKMEKHRLDRLEEEAPVKEESILEKFGF